MGLRLAGRSPSSPPPSPARDQLRPGLVGGLTRVQVGCGPSTTLRDWWNVDILAFPGVDEVVDATAPWPWTDLDFVFAEHFLEHLPPEGALRFAREAAAGLRPGGVLRLSTPSLEHVWVSHFHPIPGRAAGEVIDETYRANRAFHGWGHRFLFSKEMLDQLLTAAGFVDLSFHDYGQSDHVPLRGVERHLGWDVRDGWPSVWIVEAVASGTPGDSAALAAEIEMEFARYVRSGH